MKKKKVSQFFFLAIILAKWVEGANTQSKRRKDKSISRNAKA